MLSDTQRHKKLRKARDHLIDVAKDVAIVEQSGARLGFAMQTLDQRRERRRLERAAVVFAKVRAEVGAQNYGEQTRFVRR